MINNYIYNFKNIHIIGIGGICMSAIANILLDMGFIISGSDLKININISKLINRGATINIGHNKFNIINKDLIIYSSSININNNIELLEAKRKKMIIMNKGMIINLLSFNFNTVSIIGSHGKTTVSYMIYYILYKNFIESNFIIGGFIKNKCENFNFSLKNKYFIIESDESDKSFLYLNPNFIILTNISDDHIDNYSFNINNIINSFIYYINKYKYNKVVILCSDNNYINNLLKNININFITYGFNKKSTFFIKKIINMNFIESNFILKDTINNSEYNVKIKNCFGKYNILNATSAIVYSIILGININNILDSIYKFPGIKRRFDVIDSDKLLKYLNIKDKIYNILSLYDFGHHPNEIYNLLINIKYIYKHRRIIMIFQPHRYSRTYNFFNEYIKVLSMVNILILLEIYTANESNIFNISTFKLFNNLLYNFDNKNIFYVKNFKYIKNILNKILDNNDILIFQGAGDIYDYFIKMI